MNGLLHRLAAQAMSSTKPLSSAARPPSGTPLSVEPDRRIAPLDSAENKLHPPVNNVAEWHRDPVREQHRTNLYVEIGARENEVAPPPPELLVSPEFPAKPDRPNARPLPAKAMSRQAGTSVGKTVTGDIPVLTGGTETPITAEDSATGFIAGVAQQPIFTDHAYPPPLLPLKNAARPPALDVWASAPRGEPGSSARQGQIEETTEVHVSIGRIEVTAVHEAPQQKRQTPAAAKPMSLDDYLARRRGGA